MSTELEVGGTYFLMTFEDETFTRPVIETYEFRGKETSTESAEAGEPIYVFRIVGSEDQLVLTEAQTWQALDVPRLIERLTHFRDGKIE